MWWGDQQGQTGSSTSVMPSFSRYTGGQPQGANISPEWRRGCCRYLMVLQTARHLCLIRTQRSKVVYDAGHEWERYCAAPSDVGPVGLGLRHLVLELRDFRPRLLARWPVCDSRSRCARNLAFDSHGSTRHAAKHSSLCFCNKQTQLLLSYHAIFEPHLNRFDDLASASSSAHTPNNVVSISIPALFYLECIDASENCCSTFCSCHRLLRAFTTALKPATSPGASCEALAWELA